MIDLALPFGRRVQALPWLGLGLSTEYGAGRTGLDLRALRAAHPRWMEFLEVGADLERGFDADAEAWIRAGWPLTYHFLDLNLEEAESLCDDWIAQTRERARAAGAAWLCGDAGLWHLGPRDRGHSVLLPPVLTASSAAAMAENVRRAREQTGFEVLPENPPAHVYLGDLHLLEYFARVAEAADCGLLLDVAHLALYQHASGHAWSDGLADFPLERVVEIHVAGATPFTQGGRRFLDDDHGPEPLEATWRILGHVLPRTCALRALVYEAERNPAEQVLPRLRRLRRLLDGSAAAAARGRAAEPGRRAARPERTRPARGSADGRGASSRVGQGAGTAGATATAAVAVDHRRLQRTLFRMQLDPDFAARLAAAEPGALASCGPLGTAERTLLARLDPCAVAADRDGRRLAQFLRNVSAEFSLSFAALGGASLADFPRSEEFHAAVRDDRALPLALAAYLDRTAAAAPSEARALLELETRLARARRAPRAAAAPPPAGHVVLFADAELVALPGGTHARAEALRRALDAGLPPPVPKPAEDEAREVLLVCGGPARPFVLREIQIEPLGEATARLLALCHQPRSRASLAAAAPDLAGEPAELDAIVASFCRDGVLLGEWT